MLGKYNCPCTWTDIGPIYSLSIFRPQDDVRGIVIGSKTRGTGLGRGLAKTILSYRIVELFFCIHLNSEWQLHAKSNEQGLKT